MPPEQSGPKWLKDPDKKPPMAGNDTEVQIARIREANPNKPIRPKEVEPEPDNGGLTEKESSLGRPE